jgi:hypothetical protein
MTSTMLSAPRHPEIDHRTLKLVVGVVAVSLAALTSLFASKPLTSISAAYYEVGWSQSIFTGFLFAIAAFLLAYNGVSRSEMLASKLAAAAALGVALFPCKCDTHVELVPGVHAISAAAMFLILAFFCLGFYRRARAKGHGQAKARAVIYALCGIAILAAILLLGFDGLSGGVLKGRIPRLTFYGEATGLVAFGISWLTASRALPLLTREDERFSPLRDVNPG